MGKIVFLASTSRKHIRKSLLEDDLVSSLLVLISLKKYKFYMKLSLTPVFGVAICLPLHGQIIILAFDGLNEGIGWSVIVSLLIS